MQGGWGQTRGLEDKQRSLGWGIEQPAMLEYPAFLAALFPFYRILTDWLSNPRITHLKKRQTALSKMMSIKQKRGREGHRYLEVIAPVSDTPHSQGVPGSHRVSLLHQVPKNLVILTLCASYPKVPLLRPPDTDLSLLFISSLQNRN